MPPNPDPIDDLLRQARVPTRPASYWDELPDKVVQRLGKKPVPSAFAPALAPWWQRPGVWGWSLATVCLVLGFVLGNWNGQHNTLTAQEMADRRKVFEEIAPLFPNRLQAIMIDDSGVHLSLADQASVPASTPLLVEICAQGRCHTFITFSGQQIRLGKQSFDVLAGADNQVILVGKDQVWSADGVQTAGIYHIQAQPL